MRHRNRRGWPIEAALTIALFLVVQAFISGLSIGVRADPLAPSSILCLGGSSAPAGSPSGPAAPIHLTDCCTLGCPMLGGLPLPEAVMAPAPAALGIPAPQPVLEAHRPGRFELSPLHSRAPPQA